MPDKRLLLLEKLTIAWWLITTAAVLVLWNRLANPWGMMLTHAIIAAGITISNQTGRWIARRYADRTLHCWRWSVKAPSIGLLIRIALPMAMLALWYGETYSFCSLGDYKDHVFAGLDQSLFGCQPSIEFSASLKEGFLGLPEGVFSELFNLGYYSYFYMQLVVLGYYFICHRSEVDRAATLILGSFFLFYIIYFFLPVAGPQYYFQAIGVDAARAGNLPDLGNYFASHTDIMPAPGWGDGLFYKAVESTQATGEYPTAAFPSSHVGCTVVFLCLAWRRSKRVFAFLLPFAILLACATVYIQAHYLVDAICGLLCGLVIYSLLSKTIMRVESCSKLQTPNPKNQTPT